MKVLLLLRPDALTLGGGDVKATDRLAAALRQQGIEASWSAELHPDLSGVDLVHLSNLYRLPETAAQAAWARRCGVPYVITTNYYPTDDYWRLSEQTGLAGRLRHLGGARMEQLKALTRLRQDRRLLPEALRLLAGVQAVQARILQGAAAWLPTSLAEGEQLKRDFPGIGRPIHAVSPFGLETVEPGEPPPGLPDGPFVLCAGRLEANKNQGLLIEAIGDRYPLVLAGARNPRHQAYAERVLARLQAVGGVYVGPLDAPALWATYRRARIHAQPSFYETAGLANLEAASQGCQIVCTDRGYARSFLGDHAFYAPPDRPAAWRAAIGIAWQAPPVDWRDHLSQYTWEHAAIAALKAYQCALDRP